jgi:uncharacterized Zn-binding protein involved in type VI secretion
MTASVSRRHFLQTTAAAAALGGNSLMAGSASKGIQIEEPFHGAVLHARLGTPVAGGLKVRVCGTAPADAQVKVQGQPATREGKKFSTEVILREPETDIVAVAEGAAGRQEDKVRVVWDRNSFRRYRFSIDDNSFFLRDLHQQQYKSLFDCFYLAKLRELNQKYGTKFTLNIYYTTEDGFDISQLSDRWKGQFRDNGDWMKLAFHAYANMPNRPYQSAPPEKLCADFDKVVAEIQRFAGQEAYAPPTVIHWGMTLHESFTPLYERGVRALSGYFERSGSAGKFDVNYRWDDVHSEWLSRHDAFKDFQSGIVFSKIDIVVNTVKLDKILPKLEPVAADPNKNEIMDLFTHEQYFWPFYHNYLPDHWERMDTAIRFVTERGYKPVWLHEGLLGAPA